ncbi:PREDICTED: putative vitellogenin receptor [Tinamus guttatus]|uniref:putative vitellogenin receptor n=1 Tax=Tinamus guttatus TaxID=94827 RepID=UPI00052E9617|nr:PREDICTED: putative vitellogenin receptor [Tinamus guttatus]
MVSRKGTQDLLSRWVILVELGYLGTAPGPSTRVDPTVKLGHPGRTPGPSSQVGCPSGARVPGEDAQDLLCRWDHSKTGVPGEDSWTLYPAIPVRAGLGDGRGYVTVLGKDVAPEQLVVHPAGRSLYWVNRGQRGRTVIATAGMDGSDRRELMVVSMEEPVGLTLDQAAGRLYWISEYKEPLGLPAFESRFFWADGSAELVSAPQAAPRDQAVLLRAPVSAFTVLHALQQPPREYHALPRDPSAVEVLGDTAACAPGLCSHLCLLSPVHPQGYQCACPEGLYLLPSGMCAALSIMYAEQKSISLVQVGPGAHSRLVQRWPEALHLQDVDWQRSVLYGTDDSGMLLRIVGHPGRREAIPTTLPVCSARVDIRSGDLYWLACNRRDIGVCRAPGMAPRVLLRARGSVQHLFVDGQRGALYWLAPGQPLQQLSLAGGAPQAAYNESWPGGLPAAMDSRAFTLLWSSSSGLQALSLLKKQAATLAPTWPHGLVAAYKPYMVSSNGTALLLWDRRTLALMLSMPAVDVRGVVTFVGTELQASNPAQPSSPVPRLSCPRTHVLCRDGTECVAQEYVCDGEKDCVDGSDEDGCAQLCDTPGSFRCSNGAMCVRPEERCDGLPQCPDASDEAGCWHPTSECARRCDGNFRCVPESWLCDGHADCLDGADEQGCGELPCPRSGECVPEAWRCDGDPDCRDGTDEEGCPGEEGPCREQQWGCCSGHWCIPNAWRCDGEGDCADGSDEDGCQPAPCQSHEYPCGLGTCLNLSLVCNGHRDCADGSDEGGSCSVPCQLLCSQLCYHSPQGPRCQCSPGYRLAGDGVSCMDVDECKEQKEGPCSQTCLNAPGSYSCACLPGYLLEPDGRGCKLTGPEPTLLVAVQSEVLSYGLRSGHEEEDFLAGPGHGEHPLAGPRLGQEGHAGERLLYWSEVGRHPRLMEATMDGSRQHTLLDRGLGWPTALALDLPTWRIFWLDEKLGSLGSAHLDGTGVKALALSWVRSPFAAAVCEGELYWSERSAWAVQRVDKATGKNRTVVLKRHGQPHGLQVMHPVLRPNSSSPCVARG